MSKHLKLRKLADAINEYASDYNLNETEMEILYKDMKEVVQLLSPRGNMVFAIISLAVNEAMKQLAREQD